MKYVKLYIFKTLWIVFIIILLKNADFGVRIAEFGFWITDCGSSFTPVSLQLATCNPQPSSYFFNNSLTFEKSGWVMPEPSNSLILVKIYPLNVV